MVNILRGEEPRWTILSQNEEEEDTIRVLRLSCAFIEYTRLTSERFKRVRQINALQLTIFPTIMQLSHAIAYPILFRERKKSYKLLFFFFV